MTRWVISIGRIVRDFFRDDCLNLAANISFCAILAVIPIAMLMVSIAGFFLGMSQEAFDRIVLLATDFLPVGRDLFVRNLMSILDQKASLGIVGVIILIFASTVLVASIERALDQVFKTTSRRNFFHSRLLGIALIFWVTLLFSLPTMAQILEGLLDHFGFNFPLSEYMSGKVYLIVLSFLSYLMMVVVIPNRKVYVRYAVVGGVFFSGGLIAAKFLFLMYLQFALKRYNIIYGSLTVAVMQVVWIYYLAVIMLLSAEIIAAIQSQRLFHRYRGEG